MVPTPCEMDSGSSTLTQVGSGTLTFSGTVGATNALAGITTSVGQTTAIKTEFTHRLQAILSESSIAEEHSSDISIIRGTPLLVQLFIVFYALPQFDIVIDPFPAAVIARCRRPSSERRCFG